MILSASNCSFQLTDVTSMLCRNATQVPDSLLNPHAWKILKLILGHAGQLKQSGKSDGLWTRHMVVMVRN